MRAHSAFMVVVCALAVCEATAAARDDAPLRYAQAQQPAAQEAPAEQPPAESPVPGVPVVDPDAPVAAPPPEVVRVGPHAPQCSWVGQRVQLLLARDDVIAAREFLSIYRAFDCPVTHLARAFGCLVAEALPEEASAVEQRARQCWNEIRN